MHYHLEVVIPPVEDVKTAMDQILSPFDENGKDEDGDPNRHVFWDWWVIGGRWSGVKTEVGLDSAKKSDFHKLLNEKGFTVSGLQTGKPRLVPEIQEAAVDALWRDFFPESPLKSCPFFAHFNDQYKDAEGFPDVMSLRDTPKSIKASRIIVAGPSWNDDAKLEAQYMIQESFWNGVSHLDVQWDRTLSSVLEDYEKSLSRSSPDYADKQRPRGDWLVVTIDYHS